MHITELDPPYLSLSLFQSYSTPENIYDHTEKSFNVPVLSAVMSLSFFDISGAPIEVTNADVSVQ